MKIDDFKRKYFYDIIIIQKLISISLTVKINIFKIGNNSLIPDKYVIPHTIFNIRDNISLWMISNEYQLVLIEFKVFT